MKESIYIYNSGTLKRKDDTIQFVFSDGKTKDLPIERIDNIYLFGEVTINTKIINFLSKNGILVHFFNYYDYYTCTLFPRQSKVSGELLIKQVEHYTNEGKRLDIAKEFVGAAADNIYRNLRYYNSRGKDLEKYMREINFLRKEISSQDTIGKLMGIEGNIRKVYYSAWEIILDNKYEFFLRVKRPPDNIVNTLISFTNSLVYSAVLSELYVTQLNPTISYLHEPSSRRFSLSLDVAEIFKPLIADRLIFKLLNKKQIQEKHFMKELNNLHLTKEGSQIVLQEFDDKLKRILKHKDLNREVSYRYLMRLEGYKIIKHLIGEKNYNAFRIWW